MPVFMNELFYYDQGKSTWRAKHVYSPRMN